MVEAREMFSWGLSQQYVPFSPSLSVLKHKGSLQFAWFVCRVNVLNSDAGSLDDPACAWESQLIIFKMYLYSVSIN